MPADPRIPIEQAVYGSFPFWDRGYDLLARSPRCPEPWIDALRDACQKLGERPRGAAPAGGLFARPIGDGAWMIVGPAEVGCDDQGRPGATAFHALFLDAVAYQRIGSDPFALAGLLRREWGPADRDQPLASRVEPPDRPDLVITPIARAVAAALAAGRRVAIESDQPIDDLAAAAWSLLPDSRRRTATVATWAFTNGHRFDLLGLPRLAGVELDASYLAGPLADAEAWLAEFVAIGEPVPTLGLQGRRFEPIRDRRVWLAVASVAIVALSLAAARITYLQAIPGPATGTYDRDLPTDAPGAEEPTTDLSPPDRKSYPDDPEDDQAAEVWDGLDRWSDRFGLEAPSPVGYRGRRSVGGMIGNINGGLKYRGPLLTDAERDRLAAEPDGDRLLEWDAHIRHFLPDRPLPLAMYQDGPLRWQLDTLAWAFHIEPDPRLTLTEIPYALSDALSLPRPVHTWDAEPYAARYPAAAPYAEFLARLPRR